MSTALLPATVGHVLDVAERPEPLAWLVDGVVSDHGLSAVAVADSKTRTALGVEIVRGLVGADLTPVLGRPVTRTVDALVVLATSPWTASVYRGALLGDDRVTVAAVRPWDGDDPSYWPALHALCKSAGAVVIDAIQGLANGSFAAKHVRELESFAPPVVGLYIGNETKAGIGGDVAWAGARRRWWLEPKTSSLHGLDCNDPPWSITHRPFSEIVEAISNPAPVGLTAPQVGRLGELARKVDHRGGPSAIVGRVLVEHWPAVISICGTPEVDQRDIVAAIGENYSAWSDGLNPASPAAVLPEAPPF